MLHCAESFKVERSLCGADALSGPCVVSMAAARFFCAAVSSINMQSLHSLHLKSAPATFVRSLVARLDPSSWLQSLL